MDWVPPRTAAKAWRETRTMLFSGVCAESTLPDVWAWNRSMEERGSRALNRSRTRRAHILRAALNLATSSNNWMSALKKKESRGAT
jgi:hypothetical protein